MAEAETMVGRPVTAVGFYKIGLQLLLTPEGLALRSIRPAGAAAGERKRPATPGAAIAVGADYLVAGRPITHGHDPRRAGNAIVGEIEQAAAVAEGR